MTDISLLIMSFAQSVLLFVMSKSGPQADRWFKGLMISGNLAVLAYIGALFFGGVRVEAPMSDRAVLLWYAVAFSLFIGAIVLTIHPRGPWSRRQS